MCASLCINVKGGKQQEWRTLLYFDERGPLQCMLLIVEQRSSSSLGGTDYAGLWDQGFQSVPAKAEGQLSLKRGKRRGREAEGPNRYLGGMSSLECLVLTKKAAHWRLFQTEICYDLSCIYYNDIVFLISFQDHLLLVYRNTIDFFFIHGVVP